MMTIIYSTITLVLLYFIINTIVHSSFTHRTAHRMKKQFEKNIDESNYHNDYYID
ncbi:hypothetical protein PAECIP112173_01277 [Paenibacillus sp. JJ-100]|nr:hypothetical protein PAECIP112173_01277 [Paenibacillus sp. JJ-100]